MQQLEPIIHPEEIAERVRQLGDSISRYYAGTPDLLVIGLLKGSFMFLGDLVRRIGTPHEIAFLAVESYGDSRQSSGRVRISYDPRTRIRGRSVLLVDDIIDTGSTMNCVLPLLEKRKAGDIQVCVLLHKRIASVFDRDVRWVGFDAPAAFLVGYGLGLGDRHRHLPYIAAVVDS